MAFQPVRSATSSQVWFLHNASISSCIAIIHIETFGLCIASRKLLALLLLLEDNMHYNLPWHSLNAMMAALSGTMIITLISHFASSNTCSLCFNFASKESFSPYFSSIKIVVVSLAVLLFLCSLYSSFSTNTTSLLMTTLWAVRSHRQYPLTPSVYLRICIS